MSLAIAYYVQNKVNIRISEEREKVQNDQSDVNKSFINFSIQNADKTTSKMWLVVIATFVCNLLKFGVSMLDRYDTNTSCFSSH